MSDRDLLLFLAVMAAATFLTRAMPFIAMHRFAEHPMVKHVGAKLPPMLMIILVVYGVLTLSQEAAAAHMLTGISMAVTAGSQWLWRHPLLSIVSGTGVYIAGTHWLGL